MAKLTASKRASLPKKDFAGPGRSFPVNDKAHAKAALMLEKNAPPSARPKITAKADRVLGKKPGGGGMTAKQDAKYDKAHGIKPGSPADKKMDRKLMAKPGGGGSGVIGRTPGPKPVKGPAMHKPSTGSPTARATGGGRMPAPRRGSNVRYGTG